MMIIGHVYDTKQKAKEGLNQFINIHSNSIWKSNKIELSVTLRNGDLHCFMDKHTYKIWCLGKTYRIADKYYHSGYEVSKEY